MLLVTGMPRSGTSFTQKFFNFAYQNGDKRYFVPDQNLNKNDFLTKYGWNMYGPQSLFEDHNISATLLDGKSLHFIPRILSVLETRWKSWGEPVLKHPMMVLAREHLNLHLLTHVIITHCEPDKRWIDSVESQAGLDWFVHHYQRFFLAKGVQGIGEGWLRACWDARDFRQENDATVSMIPFGDKGEFVSTMCGLGYDQELVEKYWSTQWQGSRFEEG